MKIKRVKSNGVFKGYSIEYKEQTGHISLGRNEYSLYIHGNYVGTAKKFKDIKQLAFEEFTKRYGATLTIKTLEKSTVTLEPLKGKVPSDFCAAVATLQRPYIAISEDEYKKVFDVGNDYFKYADKVVTFGNADGGYALMPLQYEYAEKILARN